MSNPFDPDSNLPPTDLWSFEINTAPDLCRGETLVFDLITAPVCPVDASKLFEAPLGSTEVGEDTQAERAAWDEDVQAVMNDLWSRIHTPNMEEH